MARAGVGREGRVALMLLLCARLKPLTEHATLSHLLAQLRDHRLGIIGKLIHMQLSETSSG
jgi:hypothetical protein